MNLTSQSLPMNSRPKVLVFSKVYLPGYRAGGPIRSIANMVERLGEALDFKLVTTDRDLGDSAPYGNINSLGWNQLGNAQVRYLASDGINLRALQKIIEEVIPDYIYLNGFFDPAFTQRVLWLRRLGRISDVPIVLAPRGEFSTAALKLKARKKRAFMHLSRLTGLYRNLTWQASSAQEKADILRSCPFALPKDINTAPNISEARDLAPARTYAPRAHGAPLRLCYLSRISPMKNLCFALSCLNGAKESVEFDIYGPQEDSSYWAQCKAIIAVLPNNVSVSYRGEVDHNLVEKVLARYDLFFLPTRGENYGHVIYEALSAGLPVLISDRTPWRDLERHGVGWALPLDDPSAFSRIIDSVAVWPSEHAQSVYEMALSYARAKSEDYEVVNSNLEMFRHKSTKI